MARISEITRHHTNSVRPGAFSASRAPFNSNLDDNVMISSKPPDGCSSFTEAIALLFVYPPTRTPRALNADEIAREVGAWAKNISGYLTILKRSKIIEPYVVAGVQHWGLADGGKETWKKDKVAILAKGVKKR